MISVTQEACRASCVLFVVIDTEAILLGFLINFSISLNNFFKELQMCKDNTSKDPFSQCEQLQGIYIQVKIEYVGTLMTH